MIKHCPYCGEDYSKCPECGKMFPHGTKSRCDNPKCVKVNAPIDCLQCGRVISDDLSGVLDFDMTLKMY